MSAWLSIPREAIAFWKNFFAGHSLIFFYLELLGGKAVFFGLLVLLARLCARRVKTPVPPAFDINWDMVAVAQVFFVFVFFQAIAIFFKNPLMNSEYLEGLVSVWSVIEYLFLFVLVWVILRFVLRNDLAHVGWHVGDFKEEGIVALRGMIVVIILAVLTNFLYWTEILERSSKILERVTLKDIFSNGVFSVIQVILVLLLSPVAEETFYRGFIYPVLRNKLPTAMAAILLSLFFAAVHFQWGYFVLLFFVSYAATMAYERTRRLLAPVGIHVFYNGMVLFGFFSY